MNENFFFKLWNGVEHVYIVFPSQIVIIMWTKQLETTNDNICESFSIIIKEMNWKSIMSQHSAQNKYGPLLFLIHLW